MSFYSRVFVADTRKPQRYRAADLLLNGGSMRKLLTAITLTLLLTVTTLADVTDTSVTEQPPTDLSILVVIVVIAIAIPNLLKSKPA